MDVNQEEVFKPLTKEELKKKWLLFTAGGIVLLCLGFFILSEANYFRHLQRNTVTWAILGAISVICISAGLLSFSEGVLAKGQLDHKERQRHFNKTKRKNNYSKNYSKNKRSAKKEA